MCVGICVGVSTVSYIIFGFVLSQISLILTKIIEKYINMDNPIRLIKSTMKYTNALEILFIWHINVNIPSYKLNF